jgi:uncharacterized protein (DUF885 family)
MNTPFTLTRRAVALQGASVAALLATSRAAWALPAASQGTPPHRRLNALADDYYRRFYTLFPVDATENVGDPAFEAMLQIDIGPAHRRQQRALYQHVLGQLRRMGPRGMNRLDQVTWQLLEHDATERLALLEHPSHLTPVGHMDCLPVRLAQWASGTAAQPMKTAAHYEHFLARLKKLPAWITQALANMEEGIARGITLPRPLVERTLPQLQALLPADPAASPYLASVRNFPDSVPAAQRARLAAAYRRVVEREVTPAVLRLRDYMAGHYLAHARTTSGLGDLPGGAEWYRTQVRWFTTTHVTPQEVHQLGLKEVARIRGEMEKVKAQFGYEGPLTEFLRNYAKRPEVTPFKQEAEILQAFLALNEKIKAKLPQLFERAPKAPLDIRIVEPMRRDTASDHYVPPAPDGSRPGAFYTVVTDPAKYRTTGMVALFLHEGQPGHHYQIGLVQELPLPRFRKYTWNDAYVEGWALYAEGLGRDMGLYDGDPNAWLGRLSLELHRALRLVVDTGLHAMGWTRERAMAYMIETEGSEESRARRAIERYMAWPGQALAYKIGELKLLELRERARRDLGPRFDVRAFHTQVLEDGSLPLSMLEAKIDRWVRAAA